MLIFAFPYLWTFKELRSPCFQEMKDTLDADEKRKYVYNTGWPESFKTIKLLAWLVLSSKKKLKDNQTDYLY